VSIVPQGQGAATLAQVGRMKLVNPPAAQLEKRSDGLVRVRAGAELEADAGVKVLSGAIETSNVNMAATMVDMIEYQRQFDLAVRMMRVADDNASRASTLASLS
jgi:flagellar basal-body rod protein FlgF